MSDRFPLRGRTRTAAAAVACLTVAAPLTACGVRATGVTVADGPATVSVSPGADAGGNVILFFLAPDGRLAPVVRDAKEMKNSSGYAVGGAVDRAYYAVALLLRGPSEGERAAGLTTGLAPIGHALSTKSGRGKAFLFTKGSVLDLEENAVRQLVCTAAYAESADGTTEVVIEGRDGVLPPAHCDEEAP